ncbi:MAG: DAK2 domain-containing protein [Chloroflexota bacterium]
MYNSCVANGNDLREMFAAATRWLEKIAPYINALNVYPVPDGDCGTNMLFTMRASIAEANQTENATVSSVARAMAKGALMGARGNSGVILSQIWRGLAQSLNNKDVIDGQGLAEALSEASQTAYRALSHPVEGTILTVVKAAATAARDKADGRECNLIAVLEAAVNNAREAVIETPNLLSVLKEAGVVDAGGHGLYTLLEGALLYLKGETDGRTPDQIASNIAVAAEDSPALVEEEAYGFCTQFLIKGSHLDVAALRESLQDKGKSLIVVGDAATIRVHIHTLDPDTVTAMASSLGTLHDIDIRNMDEQHKDFILMHKSRLSKAGTAVIAVVNGDGLAGVFTDLGVAAIVPGGQTMNPSVMDIYQAVEAVPSDKIIILPNNKNIIPTAGQVKSLTKKTIEVIPTETVPQGVSALIALTPEADFATSVRLMAEAVTSVKTIEITQATRATKSNGLDINAGQTIGLLDGHLLARGDKPAEVILDLLSKMEMDGAGVLTIYPGAGTAEAEAEQVAERIRQRYPSLEVGLVDGGQPHYSYIISVE